MRVFSSLALSVRPLVFALFALVATACGGAEVGETCDTAGSEDECVAEGVCDKRDDGAVVCLKRCTVQEDCAADESCNGISGSDIKACHPK